MNAYFKSLDASSKGLLIALTVATVVAVGFLTRSVVTILSPATESAVVESEPVTVEESPAEAPPIPASPFGAGITSDTARQQAEAGRQQRVREQVEHFRQVAKRNTDPDGVNQPTPEKLAEMEKNGELAW